MKRYVFRLETVLRVRRIEAALEHQRLAAAARALAPAVEHERRASDAYSAALRTSSELDGPAFVAAYEHGRRLAEALADARAERATLDGRLQMARRAAAGAERRVAVLERLSDRRRSEWLLAAQRADTAVLDDFATRRAAATAIEAVRVD